MGFDVSAAPSSGSGSSEISQSIAVDLVAASNVTLSGEQTVDGVTTSASTVLCIGQSTASENGIYTTSAGTWARAGDLDSNADLSDWIARGIEAYVGTSGSAYGQSRGFKLRISNTPATLGSDAIEWKVVPGLYTLHSATLGSNTEAVTASNLPAIVGAVIRADFSGHIIGTNEGPGALIQLGVGGSVDTSSSSYNQLNFRNYNSTSSSTFRTDTNSGWHWQLAGDETADTVTHGSAATITLLDYAVSTRYTRAFLQSQYFNSTQSANTWQMRRSTGVFLNVATVDVFRISGTWNSGTHLASGSTVRICLEVA